MNINEENMIAGLERFKAIPRKNHPNGFETDYQVQKAGGMNSNTLPAFRKTGRLNCNIIRQLGRAAGYDKLMRKGKPIGDISVQILVLKDFEEK